MSDFVSYLLTCVSMIDFVSDLMIYVIKIAFNLIILTCVINISYLLYPLTCAIITVLWLYIHTRHNELKNEIENTRVILKYAFINGHMEIVKYLLYQQRY